MPVGWLVAIGSLSPRLRWSSIAVCAATGSSPAAVGLYFTCVRHIDRMPSMHSIAAAGLLAANVSDRPVLLHNNK